VRKSRDRGLRYDKSTITRVISRRVMTAHRRAVEGGHMVELAERAVAEEELLARLRGGDERAFVALVDAYGPLMLQLARGHVQSRALAEEVVQEAWVGVLAGLDRFEGRSSLKTWILRIVINRAKTRGVREARCIPFSSLSAADDEPSVDPDRFLPADHPRWPGHWAVPPERWAGAPEERLLARETLELIRTAIRALPPRQQEVILLRDIEGWEPGEVCEALGVTEGNQRVLLHRARSKVRAELDRHLSTG
jgi:RNA polymerase sigma-70 factor (ECF subfamily)